jgi:alpha-1,2-mannosyltransferase
VPEWLFQLYNPWTTPAALLVAVTAVGWLVGLRGRRLAVLAAATAAGLGLWQGWRIGPPSGLLDLQIYVGAARDWLNGASLYDYRDGVHNLGATYPPIGPLAFVAFVPMSAECREVLWSAVSLAALAATAWCTSILAGVDRARRLTWSLWAFAAATVTIPVWLTLRQGQVNIVLWLLVVADVVAVARRSRWSGIGIGVATAVKLVPGLFIVWLVLARRGAAAARAVAAAVAATALGWALAPSDSTRYWTQLIFESSRIGQVDDPRNNSLLAVVARSVEPGPVRNGLWLAGAAVIVTVGLVRGVEAARRDDFLAATAIVGCAATLVSPISWTHHLGFAVLALAAVTTRRPRPWAMAALVGVWLVLVDPGGLGDDAPTSTVRAVVLLVVVVAMPVVTGRSRTSDGDDVEEPLDEVSAAAVDVVAADGQAPDDVGAPLAHQRGELVERLARVEGVGAEHGAALPVEER